jgi:hypothetical protein
LITFYAQEVREILAGIGAHSLNEVVGRVDLLHQVSRGSAHLDDLDLNPMLIMVDGAKELKLDRSNTKYYALRAMRIKVPTGFAMMITSLQLLQMVVGCAINLIALNYKSRGVACDVSQTNITWSLLMYFSYFILFARFFQQAYFSGSSSKRTPTVDKKQN